MRTKMKRLLTLLCLQLAYLFCPAQNLERLRQNYKDLLLPSVTVQDTLLQDLMKLPREENVSDQMVRELMERYPIDTLKVRQHMRLIKADGSFSDINYEDQTRSGWQPMEHAERTLELCKLYQTPRTGFYHQPQVSRTIHQLFAFWFTRRPTCPNWWCNEIGIPKTIGPAFLLMESELTAKERQQAVDVMSLARFGMTGQNKVWLAGNVLVRGLLENDAKLVTAARDTILSEITVTGKEGIQPDWSYHQHGPQLQTGNYGLAFLSGMAFYYKLFQSTGLDMPVEKLNILRKLMDEGFRWTIWHRAMDVSSLARQLYHNVALHKGYVAAFTAEELGQSGFPQTGNGLIGHRHYPYSDYTIHRSPTWMATLKMCSERTIGTEYVNEDNRRGLYLGDGATYFYNDYNDYMNVFPLWDWRKIPGTTAYDSAEPPVQGRHYIWNKTTRVGGLSHGLYGMSAMELNRDGLHGRKAWVFTPDLVICLGTGISSDSSLEVTTCIDQRLGDSLVTLNHKGMPHYYHHRTGYIPLMPMQIDAFCGKRTGTWADNMMMYPKKEVRGRVMQLSIRHGHKPSNGQYAYAVMPDANLKEVKKFKTKDIRIWRNDTIVQMVGGKALEGKVWVVAYEPTVAYAGYIKLDLPKPGIYCFEIHRPQAIQLNYEPFGLKSE